MMQSKAIQSNLNLKAKQSNLKANFKLKQSNLLSESKARLAPKAPPSRPTRMPYSVTTRYRDPTLRLRPATDDGPTRSPVVLMPV